MAIYKTSKVVAAIAAAAFSFSASANELDSLRDLQLQLLERFDLLEQEVQMLRGTVEEQARTIQTLQSDGRSRYLDLDSRISALSTQPPATAVLAPAQPAVDPAVSIGLNPVVSNDESDSPVTASVEQPALLPVEQPAPLPTPVSQPQVELGDPALENQRYQAAFSLIRERQFDEAKDALNLFIQQYPDGKLLADAKYWLAQVYDAQQQSDEAVIAFSQLLANHPDYRRAPQARLKLGQILIRQDKPEEANRVFTALIELHGDTEQADEARRLLNP